MGRTEYSKRATKLIGIPVGCREDVFTLNDLGIDVDRGEGGFVRAIVNDEQIDVLRNAGFQADIIIDDYQRYMDEIFNSGFFHTYEQVSAVLETLVTQYPDLCRLDTIGYSVQGRAIWAVRVTDNVSIEEDEAEIRLRANMHGNEHIGTEITLYYLRYLLDNYGLDPRVQALIDKRELWLIPVQNPDGKVLNQRHNANHVDLNRDYGFFWNGWGGSTDPCSQPETGAMIHHFEENNISFEHDYHSWMYSSYLLLYPWDYHPADPPDSQYVIAIIQVYADSVSYPHSNGFDNTQLLGTSSDHVIGIGGAFSYASEHPDVPDSAQIDTICVEHRRALLDICERAGWGIEGVVKDSLTDSPLYARVEFIDPDRIAIYTDPTLGDFHKMAEAGTYDLKISVNGYASKVFTDIVVPDTGSISIGDVVLTPEPTFLYAFKPLFCRYANHAEDDNKTRPRSALGQEDELFFSLGRNGYAAFDMGQNSPIIDGPGDDFTVTEGDDGIEEGFAVYVSDDWEDSWYHCGSATGTASFDLETAGLTEARYVKIVDDDSEAGGPYSGYDLDAIRSLHGTVFVCGDVNGDGILTPSDGFCILNYLGAGPEPVTCWSANVNGDDEITSADGYHMLNYIGGGPDLNCQPCEF